MKPESGYRTGVTKQGGYVSSALPLQRIGWMNRPVIALIRPARVGRERSLGNERIVCAGDRCERCNGAAGCMDQCRLRCQNRGTCSLTEKGEAKCACAAGWTGERCETAISGSTNGSDYSTFGCTKAMPSKEFKIELMFNLESLTIVKSHRRARICTCCPSRVTTIGYTPLL
ncbi:hypothetical protein EVAR_93769_1 [Eumeta japonica]|uniref:EGF-like domain-containing protein n=1 Tax=Eumeta variegata TaxID=151549 RepID=A0A4C1VAE9_EUMVA|nr:hypothetical protein EVAR_93769_1 [Eumeta japonica]